MQPSSFAVRESGREGYVSGKEPVGPDNDPCAGTDTGEVMPNRFGRTGERDREAATGRSRAPIPLRRKPGESDAESDCFFRWEFRRPGLSTQREVGEEPEAN